MTTLRRYLFYRLKNSVLRILIFSILSILLSRIVLREGITAEKISNRASGLYIFAIILGIIASLIPFFELSGFKNRRNLDTLFFFPIKREKMGLAVYISGLLQMTIIYTVTYVAGFIFLVSKTTCFALIYMLPYFFLSLLLGAVIYSVFMFLFSEANTVTDGVLFCLLWIFLLYMVSNTAIWEFTDSELRHTEAFQAASELSGWGIIYAPINNLTVLFQELIEIHRSSKWDNLAEEVKEYLYMFFVWGVIGIAAAVGYVYRFAKKGAEKAGEISESWFGYRILIPIYGYCLIFLTTESFVSGFSVLSWLIFALMIIGYVVYRRSFRLKKSDICGIVAGVIPFILALR